MAALGQPGIQSSGIDPTQNGGAPSEPQGSPFDPMDLPVLHPNRSTETTFESVIDPDKYGNLALYVKKRFDIFRAGKQREIEPEMIESARACKGEYSPSQLANLKKNPNGSKVFINITAAEVAKATTLMLAVLALEEGLPYDIEPSADPEIDGIDTTLLKELVEMAKKDMPPEQVQQLEAENDFEGAVKRYKDEAQRRCDKMGIEVQDNLDEMHFEESLVRMLPDLAELGTGIFYGPLSKPKKPVKWRKDAKGKWGTALKYAGLPPDELPANATEEERAQAAAAGVAYRPDMARLDPFTVYPDPLCTEAKTLTECIVRGVVTSYQLGELRKDKSYSKKAIEKVLEAGKGDWTPEVWEISVEDGVNPMNKPLERYILLDFWGFMSGTQLKENGIPIPKGTETEFLLVNLIVCNGRTLKATVSNRDPARMPFHFIPYRIQRGRIWGKGVPKQIEDGQAIFNASERAKMDNAGLSVGPMGWYDMSLISPTCDPTKLHPLKMFPVESVEGLSQPPVQFFQPRSNVPEMNAIQESVKWHIQKCTGIPDSAVGLSAGSGPRTTDIKSMEQAQALAWIRGVIGNMDLYGFDPIISAIYDWNMQFNPDESIKGDFNVVVRGVQGAMSREVLGQRINDFMNKFQSPELAWMVDWEKAGYLIEKTGGVQGTGLVLPYEEALKRKMAMEQQSTNIKTAPDRMSPQIPPMNAALEILQNTPDTSPLYGPAYENALQAFGMMNASFAAAVNIHNEIAASQAAQMISPEDKAALAKDVVPPMQAPPGAGDPAAAGPGELPAGMPPPPMATPGSIPG